MTKNYQNPNKDSWNIRFEPSNGSLIWQGTHLKLTASADAVLTNEQAVKPWRLMDDVIQPCNHLMLGCDTRASHTFIRNGMRLIREICYLSKHPETIHIRLLVKNESDSVVRMNRLVPLRVEGSDALRLGSSKAGRWSFYRTGRQKNDLPAVCILGRDDGAYQDAVTGLTETGQRKMTEGEIPNTVMSDELSLIKANEGAGYGSLLLGFVGAAGQLVECEITTDSTRQHFQKLEAACLMDNIDLAPNSCLESEWLRLDGREDSFTAVAEFVQMKSKLSGSKASANPPSVYCTWYYYGDSVSEADVMDNVKVLHEEKIPIDVVQIDAGWEIRYGDWEANQSFPQGMDDLAGRINQAGFRPGIWTAPFIVEPRCNLIYSKPHWLLRNSQGDALRFQMNSMNNYILDVTQPEVQLWLEQLYQKLVQWGYTYHKLDFTRAVIVHEDAVYWEKGLTRAQVFRKGMEAVRRGIGPDSYLLVCGGLFSAASGLINGHRTSADVRSMWNVPKGNWQSRMVAPFTVKQNVLRYWMNQLWHNDPDALMIRRNTQPFRGLQLSLGLLSDTEADIIALNQYFGGGLICFTEPMKELDEDRKGLLRHVIPSLGEAAVPRDMMDGKRFSSIFDMTVQPAAESMEQWHTVTVINWSDEPADFKLKLDEKLLGEFGSTYPEFVVTEFWSGQWIGYVAAGSDLETGMMQPHSSLHYRIAPRVKGIPQLVHSDGHFSMGGREITDWVLDGEKLSLHVSWSWNYPVTFTITAPEGAKWNELSSFGEVDADNNRILRIQLKDRFEGDIRLDYRYE